MSASKLKKELQQMSKEQVIEIVLDIYEKVPKAKEFFEMFLSYDVEKLAEKYKKQIQKYIFPNSQYVTRDSEARKIIREIRKMEIDELTVELELYYVERSIDFIDNFGDLSTTTAIDAIEKMLYSAEEKIKKRKWTNDFEERLRTIKAKGNNYGIFEY